MWMMVSTVAVLAAACGSRRSASGEVLRLRSPVIDARTDRELQARYLNGEIGIDVYLDRRYGTAFSSAGDRRRAG